MPSAYEANCVSLGISALCATTISINSAPPALAARVRGVRPDDIVRGLDFELMFTVKELVVPDVDEVPRLRIVTDRTDNQSAHVEYEDSSKLVIHLDGARVPTSGTIYLRSTASAASRTSFAGGTSSPRRRGVCRRRPT